MGENANIMPLRFALKHVAKHSLTTGFHRRAAVTLHFLAKARVNPIPNQHVKIITQRHDLVHSRYDWFEMSHPNWRHQNDSKWISACHRSTLSTWTCLEQPPHEAPMLPEMHPVSTHIQHELGSMTNKYRKAMESQDPSTSEIASQTSCLDHCDMLGLKTSRLSLGPSFQTECPSTIINYPSITAWSCCIVLASVKSIAAGMMELPSSGSVSLQQNASAHPECSRGPQVAQSIRSPTTIHPS